MSIVVRTIFHFTGTFIYSNMLTVFISPVLTGKICDIIVSSIGPGTRNSQLKNKREKENVR